MTSRISALLVATMLLAAASTARATVLSDNLGEYTFGAELAKDTLWLTASFGTDGSPYDLTSVVLDMGVGAGSGQDAVVEIYTSTGTGIGAPGVLVGSLTFTGITSPYWIFTASGITLSPFSTYWVVLRARSKIGKYFWDWSPDSTGSGVGFQHTWGYSEDSGASWTTYDQGPLQMQVNADPLTPFTDFGSSLPGVSGAPQLWATGTLLPGTSGALHLASAAPSAPALLLLSLSSTPTPFKGGTLLTVPVALAWPAPTDALGGSVLAWHAWPGGFSGHSVFVQVAIPDAAAVKGVALSNALGVIVP